MMTKKYYAEIREYHTDVVVKRIECTSQRAADKMADAFDINLDHEKYYSVAFEEK
jgi:hypothetical protein